MAKKQLYFDEAERLFVIEQHSITAIAQKLNLAERTVRLWKDEGKWDEKRVAYLKSKQTFHEELYDFCRLLMLNTKNDMANNVKPDQSQMYTLGKLLPLITKVKDYEDAAAKKEPADKTGLTADVIKEIEAQVLGL
ncbi:MAG: hypothetical protein HQL00_13425 [Nitrospirae bacterium]|nr:hypothetical protein [Nitrospirota bacterium]